jgi:hypothetical protein
VFGSSGFRLGSFLVVLVSARAAGAGTRVGYLGSEAQGPVAAVMAAFEAGVAEGLRDDGAVEVVVLPSQTAAVGPLVGPVARPCASVTCIGHLAAETGAQYFVRGRLVEKGSTSYAADLQVIRAVPFEVVAFQDFTCENCIPALLGQQASNETAALMRKLVDAVKAERPRAAAAHVSAAPHAFGAPRASVVGESTGDPLDEVAVPETHRTLKWVLAGVAALGVAGGVTLLSLDRRSTCPGVPAAECVSTVSFTGPGAAILGTGLAAGIASFLVHRADQESASLSLAIGPRSVGVVGWF